MPKIKAANHKILKQRKHLLKLYKKFQQHKVFSHEDIRWLESLYNQYLVFDPSSSADWEVLFKKIDIIPVPIVLHHALLNSAYGTSQNFIYTKNLFNIICYPPNCGIRINKKNTQNNHYYHQELKKYSSIHDSLVDYIINVNVYPSYKKFRELRYRRRQEGKQIVNWHSKTIFSLCDPRQAKKNVILWPFYSNDYGLYNLYLHKSY